MGQDRRLYSGSLLVGTGIATLSSTPIARITPVTINHKGECTGIKPDLTGCVSYRYA